MSFKMIVAAGVGLSFATLSFQPAFATTEMGNQQASESTIMRGEDWQSKSGHVGTTSNRTVMVRSRTWDGSSHTWVQIGTHVVKYYNKGWQTNHTPHNRNGSSHWWVSAPRVYKPGTRGYSIPGIY